VADPLELGIDPKAGVEEVSSRHLIRRSQQPRVDVGSHTDHIEVVPKAGLSTRAIRLWLVRAYAGSRRITRKESSGRMPLPTRLGVLRYSPMILINTRLRRPPSNSP
jgi:hypothetical protein